LSSLFEFLDELTHLTGHLLKRVLVLLLLEEDRGIDEEEEDASAHLPAPTSWQRRVLYGVSEQTKIETGGGAKEDKAATHQSVVSLILHSIRFLPSKQVFSLLLGLSPDYLFTFASSIPWFESLVTLTLTYNEQKYSIKFESPPFTTITSTGVSVPTLPIISTILSAGSSYAQLPDSPTVSSPSGLLPSFTSSSSSVSSLLNLSVVEYILSSFNNLIIPTSFYPSAAGGSCGSPVMSHASQLNNPYPNTTTISFSSPGSILPRLPQSALSVFLPTSLITMINNISSSYLSSLPLLIPQVIDSESSSPHALDQPLSFPSPLENITTTPTASVASSGLLDTPTFPLPFIGSPVAALFESSSPSSFSFSPSSSSSPLSLSISSSCSSLPSFFGSFFYPVSYSKPLWSTPIIETPDGNTFGNLAAQYPFCVLPSWGVSPTFLLAVLFNTFSLFLEPVLKPSVVNVLTDISNSGLSKNPDYSTPRVELFHRFFSFHFSAFSFFFFLADCTSILARMIVSVRFSKEKISKNPESKFCLVFFHEILMWCR
jgi:hypothetical protein